MIFLIKNKLIVESKVSDIGCLCCDKIDVYIFFYKLKYVCFEIKCSIVNIWSC